MLYSTGMKEAAAQYGWEAALTGGTLLQYDGAIPATADAAVSGTLTTQFSLNGAAYTAETRAVGSIKITGGAAGTDTIIPKVAGIPLCAVVDWTTSHAATATALAAAINASSLNLGILAAVDGSDTTKVNLTAPPGTGATWTGVAVTTALGGNATTTLVNFTGGVTCVNGLNFHDSGAGLLIPTSTELWQGTTIANGSPKYFRLIFDATDTGGISTAFRRIQGTIATANADLNIPITTQQSIGGVQSLATSGTNACSFQV